MLIPISNRVARWMTVAAIGILVGVTTATGQQEEGKWAFSPPRDSFSPNALFDLRSLNEKTAGESGFVQRTPDGDFALGNGKPVRFWAVDEDVQNVDDKDALPHKARW